MFKLDLVGRFSYPGTRILKSHFQRGCFFESGVYFREGLIKNKENRDTKIKEDKNIKTRSCSSLQSYFSN